MRKLAVIFLTIGLFCTGAFAAPTALETLVYDEQVNCPQLNCPAGRVRVIEMSHQDLQALGKKGRAQLKAKGVELAENIWGDTILEGPYDTARIYRLDKIQKLFIDRAHAGYRITYSDRAWDTDTCPETRADSQSSLIASKVDHEGCTRGRIVESAFVSLDMTDSFRDLHFLATFVEGRD